MHRLLTVVLMLGVPAALHASEPEPRGEAVPPAVVTPATGALAAPAVIQEVRVQERRVAAAEADATAAQPPRGWWWTVAAIVVAGVILAVIL